MRDFDPVFSPEFNRTPPMKLPVILARRFAERNMTAQVVIRRFNAPQPAGVMGDPTLPVLLRTVYSGKARVWTVGGGGMGDVLDEDQFFSSSYVSIPLLMGGAPLHDRLQVSDVIEVTTHPDETVVGRWFRVLTVEGGGQFPAACKATVTSVARSDSWTWRDED